MLIKDPASSPAPIPAAQTVDGLRPTNAAGLAYLTSGLALVGGGVLLAAQPSLLVWAAGQLLIGLGSLQWFCLLHEAGHGNLFRARALNRLARASLPPARPISPRIAWRNNNRWIVRWWRLRSA